MSIRDIRDIEVMTTQLKYERDIQKYLKGKQTQMTAKINELTEKLINIEDQFKILTFKYENACEKINEINIIIENKEKQIDELNLIKINNQSLIEKYLSCIKELEEKIGKKNGISEINRKGKLSLPTQYIDPLFILENNKYNKNTLDITSYSKLKEEYLSIKKNEDVTTNTDNLVFYDNPEELSFSNTRKNKYNTDLNQIAEENSNLDHSKTFIFNNKKEDQNNEVLPFDKEYIMRQIEEKSELVFMFNLETKNF